jgi:hypothetical protein
LTAKTSVRAHKVGKKRIGELEKAVRKPIRPQVNRPHGFAVPDDPEALKRENALMEELHEKAVAAARREKLKLLSRRYSLAEDDYESRAMINEKIAHISFFRPRVMVSEVSEAS